MESQRELCPANEGEVAALLRSANEKELAVIPRGGGTKQDWGNRASRADLALSTARLNRVIEHAWADLTVTVQAGCTMAALQSCLAEHGQRLAIDVLWPERATVGGILSTNDSGTLRLVYGGLRDLVIGITLVLADGTIARSGGKVVKNVAGYDLPKLATGALGTLGVITQASFRLHPLPQNTRTLSVAAGTTDAAQALLLEVEGSQLAHTSLQARLAASSEAWVDVRLEGTEAGMAAQEARLRGMAPFSEGSPGVWAARQSIAEESSVAKFSVLPSQIASTLSQWSRALRSSWRAVIQATGIGWLAAEPPLEGLRPELERAGGSLTIVRGPRHDAWGDPGDTLPLLRAVKAQFDPKGILNPGRFVGGI
jgi:glycolate oxidase FAD binding subunit